MTDVNDVTRGAALRVPALAAAASLSGLVAAQLVAPGFFAAHATTLALIAIAMLGLPHGVLDIRAINQAFGLGRAGTVGVLALYIALGGVTAALWLAAPVVALLAFFVVAAIHFSEDWDASGPAALSLAVPVAMFSAGATRDPAAYDAIFISMTGANSASVATEALVAMAPLAHGVAFVAAALMVRSGDTWRALAAVACILSMWLAPPVVGFAVYFVVFHSPLHLREVVTSLSGRTRWAVAEGIATFVGALAIIAALSGLFARSHGFPPLGSAVFVGLAILTVPHMIVPRIVRAIVSARTTTVPAA